VDSHAQIDHDLQQLSKRTNCVRTYSVLNGLDYVPTAARKLGMRVLLGIWIGSNKEANEHEIAQAIVTSKADRDVIDAIIVGNEVLLRREQTSDALYEMMVRVRAATQLPVTYADVWAFWLKDKNRKLAEVSDFVTIHILPYWEDEPVGVDHAMAHVDAIFKQVQQTFPDKRIYVGEVGWPSVGRQREASKPSLLDQARFTREFIALANRLNLPYNFIEAYDQPWKKRLEGTVGGYWGLYDAEGHEKFPLLGNVIADAQWWRGPLTGGVVALLLAALARRIVTTRAALLQVTLAGFTLGCLGMLQWDYLWQSNQNWQEWLAMSGWTLLCYGVCLLSLFDWSARWPRIWNVLLILLLISVAYINLGLVFDARYRDFPSAFMLLPVMLVLLNGAQPERIVVTGEGLLLGSWLLISALVIAYLERISNGSALLWCALSALLGGRVLFDYWFISGRIARPSIARQ
jgi:glucan 1,3-beta-glucosidase